MNPDPPFINIRHLEKNFQEGQTIRKVLTDLDLVIPQGEFTAILGKSGSGKSTILNLISGIDHPDSGEIEIDGQTLSGLSEQDRTRFRRKNIGFIFQFFNLLPTLTVGENILLPIQLNGYPKAGARQRAMSMLEAVGLGDRWDAFPDRLSGGEQQRVAIARALGHNPRLVLADEPTGNLDEKTGQAIIALLDRLTRQAGKNLILVTHNPDAAAFADRVHYLTHGHLEILHAGPPLSSRQDV